MRDLNDIFASVQTAAVFFAGASMAQVIKMMEFQDEDYLYTLIILIGTNDISRTLVTSEMKRETLVGLHSERIKEEV